MKGDQYVLEFLKTPPRKPSAEELQQYMRDYKLYLIDQQCDRIRAVIRRHELPEFNPVLELLLQIRIDAINEWLHDE